MITCTVRALSRIVAPLLLFTCLAVVSGCSSLASPRSTPTNEAPASTRVFYATDRASLNHNNGCPAYRTDRSTLSFGDCVVSIPTSHSTGRWEIPDDWHAAGADDQTRYLVMQHGHRYDESAFFSRLDEALAKAERKEVLLIIHGFNFDFNDAITLAAQVGYDLDFKGVLMAYSWPSRGTVSAYPIDASNLAWSLPHLRELLDMLNQRLGDNQLSLFAHSLGARLLGETLHQAQLSGRPVIGSATRHIILAAPDIDHEIFERDVAPALINLKTKITLYVASNDRALLGSNYFHGYRRAGDSSDYPIVSEGIDTIDISAINASVYGHGYFSESRAFLSDVYYLLNEDKPAARRFGLSEAYTPGGRKYWRFRP